MNDLLPSYRSSLSKYIRVEDHYRILSYIQHDTPEAEIRRQFSDELVTTAKQRYLTVEAGIVKRDKLIDLVHEEKTLTEKVRMTMYFLFMFRDQRYRDFICNEVGRKDGRWDTSVFTSQGSTQYFPGAGGRKAFTNLRQFLFQVGVLDEETLAPTFPKLDAWFPDAVEIAAQSVEDRSTRRDFLASPHGFLIRNKIHALLNVTPTELAKLHFGGTYEDSVDPLPDFELDETGQAESKDFRRWNRQPPAVGKGRRKFSSTSDPVKLERANSQHYRLEQMIVRFCRERNGICDTNRHIDVVARFRSACVVFEMKSCTYSSVKRQVRGAVSQLLEYRYVYRQKLGGDVRLCAVIEQRPKRGAAWLLGYLGSLGIGLIWKDEEGDGMGCTDFTKELLKDVIPDIGKLS